MPPQSVYIGSIGAFVVTEVEVDGTVGTTGNFENLDEIISNKFNLFKIFKNNQLF